MAESEWTVAIRRSRRPRGQPVNEGAEFSRPERSMSTASAVVNQSHDPQSSVGEVVAFSNKSKKIRKKVHPNSIYTSTTVRDIATELDNRNLPYRAGWPHLQPLPLLTRRLRADWVTPMPSFVIDKVNKSLEKHGILVKEIFFAYRVPYQRSDHHRGIDTYHTLVITTEPDSPPPEAAICATRKILMTDVWLRCTFIEVIDARALKDLNTYAIEDHHRFLQKKEVFRGIVMEEVKKRGQNFTKVEFVRRGLWEWEKRRSCRCTVVITTLTAADKVWWREILPAIKWRVRELARNAEVEVLQG